MGGLVAENYIAQYGKQNIGKLIFVGTPHLGAPKAAKALLWGEQFGIPWLDGDRMKELGRNSLSSYELLPSQTYFNKFTGYIKPYSIFKTKPLLDYPQTKEYLFEKNLNPFLSAKAEAFHSKNLYNQDFSGIDAYNITGCAQATQTAYGLDVFGKIGQVGYTSGDKTVPMFSANHINLPPGNKFFVKKGSHAELSSASGVRQLILQILDGQNINLENNVSANDSFCKFKGKQLAWRSPVEVHIYDSQGRHTGPIENNGIEYGIPGIDYEIINGEKHIFLPTDENQEYQVIAKGLNQGNFDLIISSNDNGNIVESSVFNDVPIGSSSSIKLNVDEQSADDLLQLDYSGNGVIVEVPQTSTLNSEESQDLTPPITKANPTGLESPNGWRKNDVVINLVAEDNNSGVLETEYSFDGQIYEQYTGPIHLSSEGINKIYFYSIDRAGNNEQTQTIEIKIDKTPPEAEIRFNPENKELEIAGIDNLSQTVKIEDKGNLVILTDEAENTTELEFKEFARKARMRAELLKIYYNGVSAKVNPNRFLFHWLYDKKGKLQSLNQSVLSKNEYIVSLKYTAHKNQTIIIKYENRKPATETKSGLVILSIQTKSGKIEYSY